MRRELSLWLFFCMWMGMVGMYAQQETYSLTIDDAPLEVVFEEIRDVTGYKVLFMNSEIDLQKKMSLDLKDVSLEQLLNEVFRNTPVSYEVIGQQVILKTQQDQALSTTSVVANNKTNSDAIQKEVHGTVKDQDGFPLSQVMIKNLSNGQLVFTDFDGLFMAMGAEGEVLEFSYVGLETRRITVDTNDQLEVILKKPINSLDEVVITALGLERFSRSLGYSVTEVEGEEFTRARETNVANSLAGRVAGVNVSNTVTGPAGTTRVLIRGNTSLTGDNQPLYVVDGIPIDNTNQGSAGMWGGVDGGDGIGNLNPDDIESMSVLKGNTAAALYGSRAANGVIIITTTRGNYDHGLTIELNSNYVFEEAINHLDPQRLYGHGLQGRKPQTQQQAWDSGEYSWGALLDGSDVIQFDGNYRPYSDVGSNFDRFYRTGNTFTNTLAFSGGNTQLGYRFAMSNLENESIIPNSGMRRRNFSVNVHGKGMNDRLHLQASGQYILQDVWNNPALADSPQNANYTIWQLPVTINAEDLKGDPDKLGARIDNGHELLPSSSIWFQNPYWATYQQERDYSRNRVIGSVNLEYEINDWVYLRARGGIDQWNRLATSVNPTGTGFAPNGGISESQRRHQETNFDLMLGSRHQFENGWAYDFFIGGNKMKTETRTTQASASNFALPFFHSLSNGLSNSGSSAFLQWGTNSIYGQLEVSYDDWLFFTGSGRNDWFSTLNGRDIFYPSFGLSAVVSEIWDLGTSIDYLKLRGSWAQVGGATRPYVLNQNYALGTAHLGVPQGGLLGDAIAGATINNSELQPLLVTELELGFTMQFFRDRLGIDMAFYNKQTTDDILNATISQTSGYSDVIVNVGKVSNVGIEMLLYGSPIRRNDFSWDVSFNMSYNQSKVISLMDDAVNNEVLVIDRSRSLIAWVQHVEGLPYGQISGFKYLRDANGEIVLDDNGLPLRDLEQGIVPFGSGVHPFVAGIQNNFSYKSWTLGFLIDTKQGGIMHSGTNSQLYRRGVHKNTLIGRESGLGPIPPERVSQYYTHIYNNITEEFIYDAGFVKFRELTLTYDLPSKYLENIFLHKVSASIVGRNLWVIHSEIENVDPESTYHAGNGQGLEFLSLPQTRSYGFNLNLQF